MEPPPYAPIDPTDILALIFLILVSLRRMDVKLAEAQQYPHVPAELFHRWRSRSLAATGLAVKACLLKVGLNVAWFYGARGRVHPMLLAGVGTALFVGWVVALTLAWRRGSAARRTQAELGIVLRGRAERRST